MAVVSFVSSTTTSITVDISNNSGAMVDAWTIYVNSSAWSSSSFTPALSHSAPGKILSGLSPGTGYNVYVVYTRNGSTVSTSSTVYMVTQSPPPQVPGAVPYLNTISDGYTPYTFTASWGSASGANGYNWSCDGQSGAVTGTSKTLTIYSTGSKSFSVRPYNNVGEGSGQVQYFTVYNPPDTTAPYLSISVSDITDSSFKINYSGSDSESGINGYNVAVGYGANLSYESLSIRDTTYNPSGGNYMVYGANPNTYYTVGVRAIDIAGNYTTRTMNVLTLRAVPTAPTIIARSEGGLTLSWSAVTGATAYQLDFKPNVNSVWQTVQTGSTSYALSGLAYGLLYNFRARAYNDGWSDYSGINNGTVAPKTPSINGSYNGTTVSIYTAGLASTQFDAIVIERITQSGSYVDQQSVTTSGAGVSWNLSSSVVGQYRFRAYSSSNGVTSVNYSNYLEFARPQDFNWTGGNKTAGNQVVVLASDWNALQARVNEFRVYKALGVTSFTSVSTGNTITAALYNQLANAINPLGSTGGQIATVAAGEQLTAYAINRLTACLNTVY